MNIDLENYKNYDKTIIDIIPHEKNFKYTRRLIWNEFYETNKNYIHIYFNDNEKEIEKNYLDKNDNVSKIKIIIDNQIESFERIFKQSNGIKKMKIKKYNKKIENMSYMFEVNVGIEEIDLSDFNTENITNMRGMFGGCISLKKINLKNINTKNVTNMRGMFSDCDSLEKIDLSNFDTKNVTNMNFMFFSCEKLKEINLSSFNTENVTDMSDMFSCCSSLEKLNLSNFKNKNLKYMNNMFYGCESLKEIDLSNFDSKKIEIYGIAKNCFNLKKIIFSDGEKKIK